MVKFYDVQEVNVYKKLDFGKHLVKVSEARNTTKDGDELLDKNGVEQWYVTFVDAENGYHSEYFTFGGKMANKTGFFLRACGLLEADEKIAESKKDFQPTEVVGCYLYIEIVKNEKATDPKYEKQIAFSGFEKYEKAVAKREEPKKVEPKKPEAEVLGEEEIPF